MQGETLVCAVQLKGINLGDPYPITGLQWILKIARGVFRKEMSSYLWHSEQINKIPVCPVDSKWSGILGGSFDNRLYCLLSHSVVSV